MKEPKKILFFIQLKISHDPTQSKLVLIMGAKSPLIPLWLRRDSTGILELQFAYCDLGKNLACPKKLAQMTHSFLGHALYGRYNVVQCCKTYKNYYRSWLLHFSNVRSVCEGGVEAMALLISNTPTMGERNLCLTLGEVCNQFTPSAN